MSGSLKVTFIDNASSQYDTSAAEISVGTDRNIGKLFIGDRDSASFLQLRARNCKHVVNCDQELHGLSREKDVKYCNIDPTASNSFQEAYDFIDSALAKGNNVVVHCINGIGKSAAIVLYFLMKKRAFSLAESHRAIIRARRVEQLKIRPDILTTLIDEEKKLRGGKFSISLDGRKVVYLDEAFQGLLKQRKAGGNGKAKGGTFPTISLVIFIGFLGGLYAVLWAVTGKA